jgi:putative PEP-CTERM system histidine kinase
MDYSETLTNIAAISYATGAVFFLALSLALMTGRRGRPQKILLSASSMISAIWMVASTGVVVSPLIPAVIAPSLELVRDFAWITFMLKVLSAAYQGNISVGRSRNFLIGIGTLAASTLSFYLYKYNGGAVRPVIGGVDLVIASHLMLAVAGLVLVEQMFRNTRPEMRRSIKYLYMGLGGLFAYDFYMYADALLVQHVDAALWGARGFINAMVVPLIGVAIARDAQWSLDIFISRRIVFHSTALLGTGIYLLAMGFGGYYVRIYGGTWGVVAQAIFLAGATLVLLVLLFSGQLRASLRVLISKNFFHYKYDYREEWLRFIRTLSNEPEHQLRERALRSIAQIIESPGGTLWMRRDSGRFEPVARWNVPASDPMGESADSSLVKFLEKQEWVINIEEYEQAPEFYKNLELPEWLRAIPKAWLVVPLVLHVRLLGFVVLQRSPLRRHFNWEDCDLLKTAGRQAASHLAQLEASQALADARQFEACNRLSAYVVHDLKNLIAQLSLVVTNAAKHKTNPLFIDDAVTTVQNSVTKMSRLLGHLRSGCAQGDNVTTVDLAQMLADVVRGKTVESPAPVLECLDQGVAVVADRDRLAMVIGHVVQNAQDATPKDGRVLVRLYSQSPHAVIDVEDSGCGMDESFIRERLFRPFDTTKGASGMGIGAYETREFVRALGGEVEVASKPGVGTVFTIRLQQAASQGTSTSLALGREVRRYTNDGKRKEIIGR